MQPKSQNHSLPEVTEEMDFDKKAKPKRTLKNRISSIKAQ